MSDQPDTDDLILKDHEINSVLWKRIEAHLNARLARFRAKNDNALSQDETTTLRGRIAEIKGLLAAGESQD